MQKHELWENWQDGRVCDVYSMLTGIDQERQPTTRRHKRRHRGRAGEKRSPNVDLKTQVSQTVDKKVQCIM